MTLVRAARLAVVALVVSTLFGCASVLGLHEVPREDPAGPPLSAPVARDLATRVLGEAKQGRSRPGVEVANAPEDVLTGAALEVAKAHVKLGGPGSATPLTLTTPEPPRVLAMSQERAWPRVLLVTTLEEEGKTQYLHVLVSTRASEPFKLASSVPMFAGSTLPSLGRANEGAALVAAGDPREMVTSPQSALDAYAGALGRPKPTPSPFVATNDAFGEGLSRSFAAKTKEENPLLSFTRAHRAGTDATVALRLAGGGAVVFGLLTRTDTLAALPTAAGLRIPPEYAKFVGGRKTTPASLTIGTLEPVALVVPVTGKVTAIGAAEQVSSVVAK